MLGALISGGLSLVGGLLGQSSAKKRDKENQQMFYAVEKQNGAEVATYNRQQVELTNAFNEAVRARAAEAAKVPIVTTGSVDYEGMMAAADKAGFNPVTFLQAGGLQAYSRSSVTGSTAMDAALAGNNFPNLQLYQMGQPPQNTAPGTGEVIGNALIGAGQTWLNEYTQKQQNNFQMAMLDKQLAATQALSASKTSRSGYIPQAFLAGSAKGRGTTAFGSSVPGAVSPFKNPGDRLSIAGISMPTDAMSNSGEDFETRWGEWGGALAGIGVMAADVDRWIQTELVRPGYENPTEAAKTITRDYLIPWASTTGADAGWWPAGMK